jgi:hypothetical protein
MRFWSYLTLPVRLVIWSLCLYDFFVSAHADCGMVVIDFTVSISWDHMHQSLMPSARPKTFLRACEVRRWHCIAQQPPMWRSRLPTVSEGNRR